jgi:galactose-1-phosphate uridylyltransferase
VSAGLFELRKDPITGWWVATIVDREFDRHRFARHAEPVDDDGDCQNCRLPEGEGVRLRVLKDYAFHVVGTEEEAQELDNRFAQVAMSSARAAGSWRTIVAPPREHRPLHQVGAVAEEMVMLARASLRDARAAGQTDYLQVVQNWGAQAGARTNHLCLDLSDLPLIPHRIAEELGGAARCVIREG